MPTTLKHIKEFVNQIEQHAMRSALAVRARDVETAQEHTQKWNDAKDELFQRVEGLLVVKELYEEVQNE